MAKTLFVARSYLMLITVINLRITEFKEDDAELIWTNDSVNSEDIFIKIQELGIFNKFHYICHETFAPENTIYDRISQTLSIYFSPQKIMRDLDLSSYDNLVVYMIHRKLENAIYSYCKKINKKLRCYMYEEGYISYLSQWGYHSFQKGRLSTITKMHKLLSKISGKGPALSKIDGMYFYNPKLILYKPKVTPKIIPKFDRNNEQLKTIFNKLFEISSSNIESQFKHKYIYFEQAVFEDNGAVDEVQTVRELCEIVGKENVLVKLHPRIKVNRFKEYGIDTNSITGIPWEVIQMNLNCNDKIFITISSSSVFSSLIYYGDTPKTILLFKCMFKNGEGFIKSSDLERYISRMQENYPDLKIFIPKNKQELTGAVLNNI